MKLSIGSQAYTNVVLTAIAALLLALAFDAYRIPVLGAAQAQPQSVFSRDKDDSGVNGNVSQTQDIAVASATREVAIANREIASAIREVGKSLDGLAAAVRTITPILSGTSSSLRVCLICWRSSPSMRRETPPALGLLGIKTR